MNELAAEIRAVAVQYPESRSAILPALRLAQDRYGWLPPEALEEVGEALGESSAYVQSIASFYDMFHLAPVGRHFVEVCTNVCCGLLGAQRVLAAFESELGIGPGGTSDDGRVTLRAVECLGACAWPTVVALDRRYRLGVSDDDVPEIAAELLRE